MRILGAIGRRYTFFWQGCNKGTAGVGVVSADRWIDSVVDVVRVNERIMYVKLVIGKQIVNIVSAYAPQVGLSAEEKDDFWDSFIIVLSGNPKQESIFIGSDLLYALFNHPYHLISTGYPGPETSVPVSCACFLHTPMTLASGGSPIFPLAYACSATSNW